MKKTVRGKVYDTDEISPYPTEKLTALSKAKAAAWEKENA